jgi:hypothetical protein
MREVFVTGLLPPSLQLTVGIGSPVASHLIVNGLPATKAIFPSGGLVIRAGEQSAKHTNNVNKTVLPNNSFQAFKSCCVQENFFCRVQLRSHSLKTSRLCGKLVAVCPPLVTTQT